MRGLWCALFLVCSACVLDWTKDHGSGDGGLPHQKDVDAAADAAGDSDATASPGSGSDSAVAACPRECGTHEQCTWVGQWPECTCISGFERRGASCENVNECDAAGSCPADASCADTEGSYSCICPAGTKLSGSGNEARCADPCDPSPCDPHAECAVQADEAVCSCTGNYTGDGRSCALDDRCAALACPAHGSCSLATGTPACVCASGYEAMGELCVDKDECVSSSACSAREECTNIEGGFHCACKAPFVPQGSSCVCAVGYAGPNCDQCAAGFGLDSQQRCVPKRTLTVQRTGFGYGTVSVAGQSCSDPLCTFVLPSDAYTVTLSNGRYTEVVFSGSACSGQSCAVTLSSDLTLQATNTLRHNLVFASESLYLGSDLGGLAGADAICAAEAKSRGYGGTTWIAFLSAEGASSGMGDDIHAVDRLAGLRGFVSVEGLPIADTVADLISKPLQSRIPSQGSDVHVTWTGTNAQGKLARDAASVAQDCGNWGDPARVGQSATRLRLRRWLDDPQATGAYKCDGSMTWAKILCIQGDKTQALTAFPKQSGRIAFLSTPWTPGGGLGDADAHCALDATKAGVAGKFKAMLTTSSAVYSQRFDLTKAPWVRRDGLPWVLAAADLDDAWNARGTVSALNIHADGTVESNVDLSVYIGTQTNALHCNDWNDGTVNSGAALTNQYTVGSDPFRGIGHACQKAEALYCLQE